MVAISPSSRYTVYNPVVATTDFPVNFPIFDNDDVEVRINGALSGFTVTASYVDGMSTDAVCKVTPGAVGKIEVIGLRTPARTDQYANGVPLPISNHNYSLNRLTVEQQENRRDIDRALKLDFGASLDEDHFPIMGPNGVVVDGGSAGDIASAQGAAATAVAKAAEATEQADRAGEYANSLNLPNITGNADRILVAKSDASGYDFETLNYIRGGHQLTPYDRALTNRVSPLDPMDADVGIALNELFGTVKSDFMTSMAAFRSSVDLAYRPWLSSVSIDCTRVAQIGMRVGNGSIRGTRPGRPIIDVSGSSAIHWDNLLLWGDKTLQPSMPMLLQRAGPGFGGAGGHFFSNCRFDGFYTQGMLNFGSEVNTFVNCVISNRSKGTTRPALLLSGHSSYNTKWMGTIVSDYLTSGEMLTGATSCINHNLGMLGLHRPSPWGALPILSITKSSTCTVTLVSAPNTTQMFWIPPANGDPVYFHNITGMAELNQTVRFIKKISDTVYELYVDAGLTTPLNSTAYTTFVSGHLWGSSGPALTIGGGNVEDVYGSNGYIYTLGNDALVIDSQYDNSDLMNIRLNFQHEANPVRSVRFITPATGTTLATGIEIKIQNKNQSQSVSVFGGQALGGKLVFRKPKFHILQNNAAIGSGWFAGRTDIRIIDGDIVLPRADSLITSGFDGFSGTVTTLDDARIRKYTEERAWTPDLKFGGATTGITYNSRTGWVEDAGEFQLAHFRIVLTSKGSATGSATIAGLPEASNRNADVIFQPYAGMASITGSIMGQVASGAIVIGLYLAGSTSAAAMTDANFTNTSGIEGTVIYKLTN